MSDTLHIACPACDTMNRMPRARLGQPGRCGRCRSLLFTGRPVDLDSRRFPAHAERSDLPLLIDFGAGWCGPCRMMAPVFEQAAARIEPHVRAARVDTDADPDLATRFGIRSLPTLVLVHRGVEVARTTGAMPLTALIGWVNRILAPA